LASVHFLRWISQIYFRHAFLCFTGCFLDDYRFFASAKSILAEVASVMAERRIGIFAQSFTCAKDLPPKMFVRMAEVKAR